ncbi:MAG: ABC transporter ATP-binding protein [Candidatus Saccharibacteria bacterium]|nr:ABC transporter ATP-binding protein [Candidatus Saccharibacteria bacterium]
MQPIIEAKNLSKTYGKRQTSFRALKDIDIKINAGESVAIIGKSGSGKSTLMHLLALLDRPTSGNIYINGKNTTKLKKSELNYLRNQEFGFVFQQFFMNASDTVLENVMLPLKIAKSSPFRRKELALDALKTVGLADKAKNRATNLSGGQKQRTCIARAIVNNPKIIFADEPTGNLDSANGEKITKLLFGLNREKGVTLVIVTHDEDLAKLCNRTIRISDGKISAETNKNSAKPTRENITREKNQ